MKQLLLRTIACAAVLLPVSQAGAIGLAGKNYYGLNPGKTFTLTVKEAVSTKVTLTGAGEVPIPKGVPKFKKGSKVKFKIGKKAELTGPGFSMPFLSADAQVSAYAKTTEKGRTPNIGAIKKDSKLKPVWGEMTFYKFTGSGFNTTTYMTVYVLEK